jgi:hypothetical protein
MRYYAVKLDGAPSVFPARYDNGAVWSTQFHGQNDPGAQQVEFQLYVIKPSEPSADSASVLVVHGVPWEQVSQYASLVGVGITIYGGMSSGLPLANVQSQHAGMLIQGMIQRCWGNWLGTDMSIGMTIVYGGLHSAPTTDSTTPSAPPQGGGASIPGAGTPLMYNRTGPRSIDRSRFARGPEPSPYDPGFDFIGDIGGFLGGASSIGSATQNIGNMIGSLFGGGGLDGLAAPLNFTHNLQANQPLSAAIQETLSKVFPQAKLSININPALKLQYQDAGIYQNFSQYAGFIKNLSHSILGVKGYQGVDMVTKGNLIKVFDHPDGSTFTLSPYDLVGQPTWVDVNRVHIICVMRADIFVNDYIVIPPGILFGMDQASGALPGAPQRANLTFQGKFLVTNMHHIGDLRNPDGVQWTTHYFCNFSADYANSSAQTTSDATTNSDQTTTPSTETPPASQGGGASVPGAGTPLMVQGRMLRRSKVRNGH